LVIEEVKFEDYQKKCMKSHSKCKESLSIPVPVESFDSKRLGGVKGKKGLARYP
jgi:hypothetical protein